MKTFVGLSTFLLVVSVIAAEAAEVKPDAINSASLSTIPADALPNHQRIPILRSSAFRSSSTARGHRRG